nr:hypothetical protein [Microbacterium sp.]
MPELQKVIQQADLSQRPQSVDPQPEADPGDAVVGLDVDDVDVDADSGKGRGGGQAANAGADNQDLHRFCHGVSSLSGRRLRAYTQREYSNPSYGSDSKCTDSRGDAQEGPFGVQ